MEQTKALNLPVYSYENKTPNLEFVGRGDDLERISASFSITPSNTGRPRICTLIGDGGIGKTEIALRYLFTNMESFRAILWASATNISSLAQRFAAFAVQLGLVDAQNSDQRAGMQSLLKWYITTGK